VGGGDQADIDAPGLGGADTAHFFFLQQAQESGLGLQWQLTDFVQKQGATIGSLNQSFALGLGAGEGALFVAEQLGLDQ
jgi:hypothetical protein